jgi:thioesterase domain-containing protein
MSDHSTLPAGLNRLRQRLQCMPPVRAMALRVEDFDPERGLRLWAPLEANVNDKGCAFGGSLAGLMTLACWGSVSLALDLAGCGEAEVYVQDSSVHYLAPLYDDLLAAATLTEGQRWDDLTRAYRERGKARTSLAASVRCADGSLAARLSGRFVALRPR